MSFTRREPYIVFRVEDERGNLVNKRADFLDPRLECGPDRVYLRERYVNKGKNGTVYRCHPESDGTQILAVKFLHVLTPQRIGRFDFEATLLTELDHPRVLNAIDTGEVDTTLREYSIPFMIMELMDGNLQGFVENHGCRPAGEIRKYGIEMCEAFEYVHSAGVIHRDIKPGNFLVKNNSIVVGDFGLAKTNTDAGKARFYREDLTLEGEIVGPQAFMSPELMRYARNKSHPVEQTSDLYQIGAVLWFLLTGFPPVGIPDVQDDPTGGLFFPILSQCLRTRPEERFQSAAELKKAIENINV